jgi:hypothetical protein
MRANHIHLSRSMRKFIRVAHDPKASGKTASLALRPLSELKATSGTDYKVDKVGCFWFICVTKVDKV